MLAVDPGLTNQDFRACSMQRAKSSLGGDTEKHTRKVTFPDVDPTSPNRRPYPTSSQPAEDWGLLTHRSLAFARVQSLACPVKGL